MVRFRGPSITRKILGTSLFTLAFAGAHAFADSWPCFRGNPQRTGFCRETVGIPSGKPAWKLALGCNLVSSPSVVDGVLYIGGRDSALYAISAADGTVQWRCKTGNWVDASPLVHGNSVIVGSRDNSIYVVDKLTGNVAGRLPAGIQLSSPCITDAGMLLSGIGLPAGGVAAFGIDPSQLKKAKALSSISLPQYTYSSPAVFGQAAVVGSTNGFLYGIDVGGMDTIWSLPTAGGTYLSTPAIDNTTVYFAPGDADKCVYAADLLTGRVVWKSQTATQPETMSNVLGKKVAAGTVPSSFLAQLPRMSPANRRQTIERLRNLGFELPGPGAVGLGKKSEDSSRTFIALDEIKTSSVAVNQENVFVIQKQLGYVLANDSTVDDKQEFRMQALDKKTGTSVWSFSECRSCIHLGYCSSPVATKNTVFFGWGEGRLYGLAAQTGEVLWMDSVQGNVISSPAISSGRLFVATMDGFVYAYNLDATAPGLDFQTSTYCYPNPARGSVSHLQMYVNKAGVADVTLYNTAEKPVLRFSRQLAAGEKDVYDWDISRVANGVYFALVKVQYADGLSDRKLVKVAVLH